MASSDLLNRKTRGLNSVREMLRRSCSTLVRDGVNGKAPIDIDADPLQNFQKEPTLRQACRYLRWASATGKFSLTDLDHCIEIMQMHSIYATSGLHFHLASLYLQVGEYEQVERLLSDADSSSEEITWFAALMLFARANGYTLPLSDYRDEVCLDYLDAHLSDASAGLECVLKSGDHLAVVGNAPGEVIEFHTSTRLISFNDYAKNPRFSGVPDIHVVTPSWDVPASAGGSHLIISGNSIFHRRSQVWRKFSHCPEYQSIACFPRALWAQLYSQLKAPPSAGLLMICFLAKQENIGCSVVSIEGFSNGRPVVNHEFDRVPPSARHNWEMEYILREQAIGKIRRWQAG